MMTLYGKLSGQLTRDYEVQTSALTANAEAINRFGEEMRELGLVPHVRTQDRESVAFVAHCDRGHDHMPVLRSLADRGYVTGKPAQLPTQFMDGFVIWSARVTSRTLAFDLMYYTRAEGGAS